MSDPRPAHPPPSRRRILAAVPFAAVAIGMPLIVFAQNRGSIKFTLPRDRRPDSARLMTNRFAGLFSGEYASAVKNAGEFRPM